MLTDDVVCGDAVEVMKGIPSVSIDLIITDVPYGISYRSNKQNYDTRGKTPLVKHRPKYFNKIEGDVDIPLDWLDEAYRVLKDGCAIYIFCHWSRWHLLYPAVEKAKFKCKNMIVMNKSNHGMGDVRGQFAPKHELLLFATKKRHLLNFPDKRLNDVWNVPVKFSGSRRLHPNEKPLSWLEPCIINSSQKGDIVLDPFAGSGSTGAAAKKLDRRYFLSDIDENFVDITQKRLL